MVYPTVGFIGLGIIGKPMAMNLLKADKGDLDHSAIVSFVEGLAHIEMRMSLEAA